MNRQESAAKEKVHTTSLDYREQLLQNLPVTERILGAAGITTTILEGGEGLPIILLHGPGESSLWWMRVIPKLVETHHIIIPDLPGHGESDTGNKPMESSQIMNWLNDLIRQTCNKPPILAGHILGGAIAARFAINRIERIDSLVLIDSLGLGKFRPAPMFAFRLIHYLMKTTEKTYNQFLPQCMYDAERLRSQMGSNWEPFLAYNLKCTQRPETKKAVKTIMTRVGTPKISEKDLDQIKVPISLIWGRHDRANRVKIAEDLSNRKGWPLYVIENSGDDPKLEQPEKFLQALYQVLDQIPVSQINEN